MEWYYCSIFMGKLSITHSKFFHKKGQMLIIIIYLSRKLVLILLFRCLKIIFIHFLRQIFIKKDKYKSIIIFTFIKSKIKEKVSRLPI